MEQVLIVIVMAYWNIPVHRMVQGCHDIASRFVYIMTKGKRRHLLEEDFTELIQVSRCYDNIGSIIIVVLLGYHKQSSWSGMFNCSSRVPLKIYRNCKNYIL